MCLPTFTHECPISTAIYILVQINIPVNSLKKKLAWNLVIILLYYYFIYCSEDPMCLLNCNIYMHMCNEFCRFNYAAQNLGSHLSIIKIIYSRIDFDFKSILKYIYFVSNHSTLRNSRLLY